MFASCYVIEKDNLCIFICLYFDSLGAITRGIFHRINVNNFSVSLVAEKKTCVRIGINTEIWGVTKSAVVGLPVIVREVRWLGQKHLLAFKVEAEVLCFQTVSQVNVTTNFVFAVFIISDENDRRHAAIPH